MCTALILVTVPLSYTFQDVSIPFMQLLMRGDILIIAPVVDLLMRRRVHWWSWAALGLVGVALVVTLSARGGLKLPPLAFATIVVYTIGYFGRLWIMSRVSKDDDPVRLRAFFSEEKIVAFPVAILMLLAVVAFGGRQGAELSWGFVTVWTRPEMLLISLCGLMVCLTGVFSGFILLDARENSYCVPLERSASILAGIFGSVLLAVFLGGRMPSGAEFAGAGLLIVAVTLLWLGPRLSAAAPAGAQARRRPERSRGGIPVVSNSEFEMSKPPIPQDFDPLLPETFDSAHEDYARLRADMPRGAH